MANEFRNRTLTGVGTSAATLYATPDGKTSIVLELDLANTTSNVVEASVELLDYSVHPSTGWRYIVKNAPVPAGGTLQVVAGQKIVLEERSGGTGDAIRITSSAATSIDVVAAVLEDVNP
ncbi:uncharacterized protein METZ01_LOCUS422573 [marine metagenome]|uniref:Uncharacterized protein n=1 Tax=marine metagenome TaxID=408172 RepID=A0A382XFV1_9ZZZZ